MNITKFETGKTYAISSACDHNCVWTCKVIRRTDKSVTIEIEGKQIRRGVYVFDGVESVRPFGSYSMCPILCASEIAA